MESRASKEHSSQEEAATRFTNAVYYPRGSSLVPQVGIEPTSHP